MSSRNIYKITNLINGKIYIGKTTKTIEQRFKEHIRWAKLWKNEELAGKAHYFNSRFIPALNKYGYENFRIDLVESYQDNVNLEEMEKYWINYFNSTDPNIGYNISPGGLGGPLFSNHKQSDHCKQVNSARLKGVPQDRDFVEKRSRARARLMQNLETGEIISILDLPKGYFYKQDITSYRVYKSNSKFYACLEQPHNRRDALSDADRLNVLEKLIELFNSNHQSSIKALHSGMSKISAEDRAKIGEKVSKYNAAKRKEQFERYLLENNINTEEYKKYYLEYKNECPNRHLELIYCIPYTKIRAINKYLGLFGGKSGHRGGKVSIKKNN